MPLLCNVMAIMLLELIKLTDQSIAGITYMDDVSFEQRYRNVYECDPFYWHPLHLPDKCAKMYEKLIRSRIKSRYPVRVVTNRERYNIYSSETSSSSNSEESDHHHHRYDYSIHYNSSPYFSNTYMYPFEKILNLLRKDVRKNQLAPTIDIVPGLGPAAIYHQPISRRSEMEIKRLAKAYAYTTTKSKNNTRIFAYDSKRDQPEDESKESVAKTTKTNRKQPKNKRSKV